MNRFTRSRAIKSGIGDLRALLSLQLRSMVSRTIQKSVTELPSLGSQLINMPLQIFLMQRFLGTDRINEVALVDGASGKSLTYGQVYDATYSFANHIRRTFKIGKGSVVAIFSPNDVNFFTAFHGIGLAEGITTTLNPLYTEEEAFYQINAVKASLIIAHPICMDKAKAVAARLGVPVISLGEPSNGCVASIYDMIKEKAGQLDQDLFVGGKGKAFDPNSVVTIPFSSGTTGLPKGVMLTHRNLVANILQGYAYEGEYLSATEKRPRGTCICPLPLFHIYGLSVGLNMTLYAGGKLVLMPSFDLQKFLELIQEHKVSRGFIVPPIALALAKHPMVDKFDLSSLESLNSGAAPLGSEIQTAAMKRMKCLVKQAYGMTESSPLITLSPDSMINPTMIEKDIGGSAGRLVPGTEAKIVDPVTGADLPYNSEGELLVRGPQVMAGYLNDPEATSRVLRKDGWLHTGDIARFDENGWLHVTDRCKELIKYKGFQVPPAELEAVIAGMKQVKDVVVIPVPDEEAGELPRAYVVKQDGALGDSLREIDIIQYVNARVAPYKRLRGGVIFTNVVPKSPSGKLLRRIQVQIDRAMSARNKKTSVAQ